MRSTLASLLTLGFAAAASAVIVDSGDGTGNVTAPDPDPGWRYVGTKGGLTAVALGNDWVLTANHVGAGDVVLDGTLYTFVPGTAVRLSNSDTTMADLLMFQISPPPPSLPPLPISGGPAIGTELILIGNGRNRGAATSWVCPSGGLPPPTGYRWGAGQAMRWGTNHVEAFPFARIYGTESFETFFDPGGSAHEAQAATGDSGGAAFAWTGSHWELAGILFAISLCGGQPGETALYGNSTYAADLSVYRDEIREVMPEPTGGLWLGGLLVAALGRFFPGPAEAKEQADEDVCPPYSSRSRTRS